MSEYQEITSYTKKPKSSNRQSFILTNRIASIKSSNKLDLNGLLERLNITNDINLQLKIFSSLSAYLMFHKGSHIDVIIKCNAVYDKINNVLIRGLPRKSSEALNFLSALLYSGNEENSSNNRLTLTLYARNMVRLSGSLSTMCEMFSNCMMYHDTWKALCQCLSVACSGCEMNQSYCSHLIPVCITKCNQQNLDILVVLQSLLLNHTRNLQLFLDCNGVSVFSRSLLHYDKCLQLLMTVVQFSPTTTSLLHQTSVLADLRDFLRLYGPDSQLGQKAVTILNHINSSLKEKVTECAETIISAKNILAETNDNDTRNDLEETKVLIQNVMKEVFKMKQSEMQNLKKTETKSVLATIRNRGSALHCDKRKEIYDNEKRKLFNKTEERKLVDVSQKNIAHNDTKEVSFSFLQHGDFKVPKHKEFKVPKLIDDCRKNITHNDTKEVSFSFLRNGDFKVPKHKDFKVPIPVQVPTRFPSDYSHMNIDDSHRSDITFGRASNVTKEENFTFTAQDFEPVIASTPKQTTKCVSDTEVTPNSHITSEIKGRENKFRHLKMNKRESKKELKTSRVRRNIAEGLGNRSLGARFFSAINDTCTTFVKTVKNIFHKKELLNNSECSSFDNTLQTNKRSEHSFMNYMRIRDGTMTNDNWTSKKFGERSNVTEINSCKTCDNTKVLKHKLTKDEFLKETVKKLKLGINLYGCDFKKISKTMWPREPYMTPLILYNLYRKLLLK